MINRDFLDELYYSYVSKRKEALDSINRDSFKISEIQTFLESINESDSDRKFFSPINSDSIFEGRIEIEKNELNSLLANNEINNKIVSECDSIISKFKELFNELDNNGSVDVSESIDESDIQNNTIKDIDNSSTTDINSFNRTDNISNIDIAELLNIRDKILNIQESERRRISSELHDITVQNLVHLTHTIELASLFIDQDPVRARLELETCNNNLKETIDGIRDIIFNLRPMSIDDLGLSKAIDDYITNIKFNNPSVLFDVDVDDFNIEISKSITIFRIIQESVNNSIKHSKCKLITIHVKHDEKCCNILIRDDGIGFDVDQVTSNHFGLSIMKERIKMINGEIKINSSQYGTEIIINIPVN